MNGRRQAAGERISSPPGSGIEGPPVPGPAVSPADAAVTADTASDEDLVRSFVRLRDPDLFERLVRRHLGLIRSLLWSILRGNREDMEDAEQEVLASLFLELGKFRFRCSFRTWLCRFVRNRAVDLLRKNGRERRKAERLGLHLAATAVPEDPEEQALGRCFEERILRLLDRLAPEDRMLLVLREANGLSIREIAGTFGMPEGTIKAKLHRLRNRLYRMATEGETDERFM